MTNVKDFDRTFAFSIYNGCSADRMRIFEDQQALQPTIKIPGVNLCGPINDLHAMRTLKREEDLSDSDLRSLLLGSGVMDGIVHATFVNRHEKSPGYASVEFYVRRIRVDTVNKGIVIDIAAGNLQEYKAICSRKEVFERFLNNRSDFSSIWRSVDCSSYTFFTSHAQMLLASERVVSSDGFVEDFADRKATVSCTAADYYGCSIDKLFEEIDRTSAGGAVADYFGGKVESVDDIVNVALEYVR